MAKQGLRKHGLKRPNLSQIGRGNRGEGEEEEEETKRKRGSSQKKVWKLNLCMDSMRLSMNFHALMVILLPKSRVFARVSS